MAVLRNAVAPIILAHRFAHPVIFGHAPWQGRREVADLTEFLHAKRLGFEESLVDADSKPGMAVHQGAANPHGVHDWEYAGLPKIRLLDGRVVREHAPDMGCPIE